MHKKTRYASQWLAGVSILVAAFLECPHRIEGFRLEGDRAVFDIRRKTGMTEADVPLEFYHADTLTSNWRRVCVETLNAGATALTCSLPLPEGRPSDGFYRVEAFADADADGLSDLEETSRYGTDPENPDSDGDGLTDGWEVEVGLNPASEDTDGDGLPDGWEVAYGLNAASGEGDDGPDGDPDQDGVPNLIEFASGMNPVSADSDGDGMDDGYEMSMPLDPTWGGDADEDLDGDGLTNREEYELGTDPCNEDTDGDGKTDGWEVANGSDPLADYDAVWLLGDDDGDGLTNGEEIALGSNPLAEDSDGDGLPDAWEARYGLSPTSAEGKDGYGGDPDGDAMPNGIELMYGTDPTKADTDGDGMSDRWEVAYGMNALSAVGPDGPDGDLDDDGVSNLMEFESGTNPLQRDTDGDGIDDKTELEWGMDAADPTDANGDCDGDGLSNAEELRRKTNLHEADTDGDGVRDGDEVSFGTDPLNTHSVCEAFGDAELFALGSCDLTAVIDEKGHTVWERLVYGIDESGKLMVPVRTENSAIVTISGKGEGEGVIVIGEEFLPLVSREGVSLQVSIQKGERKSFTVYGRLQVQLSSEDFCIGETNDVSGWVEPLEYTPNKICIHEAGMQSHTVWIESSNRQLECTWKSSGEVSVSRVASNKSELNGRFPKSNPPCVTGTLSHPEYLVGNTEFEHPIEYCKRCPDESDEEEREPGSVIYIGHICDCYLGCDRETCTCVCHEKVPQGSETNDEVLCPKHRMPYEECEPLHQESYSNTVAKTCSDAVLKLYDPEGCASLNVVPPVGGGTCCRCGEHADVDYACLRIGSGVEVICNAMTVSEYNHFDEPTTVYVYGTSPSGSVGGSSVTVDRGGSGLDTHRYTVLGMRIMPSAGFGDDWPEGMIPVAIDGDDQMATKVTLRSDVLLQDGDVTISFSDASVPFELWYTGNDGGWVKLLDSETRPSYATSVAHWRAMSMGGTDAFEKDVYVKVKEPGTVKLEFGFALEQGGQVIKDVAVARLHSLGPRLVFDYDRDGVIGEKDIETAKEGKTTFRFWVNSDEDEGDVCKDNKYNSDGSGGSNPNHGDGYVNGRRDLVDFTPVWIDLSETFPEGTPDSFKERIVWVLRSSCFNAVMTAKSRLNVGAFQHQDVGGCGANLDRMLHEADVCRNLFNGQVLPEKFCQKMLHDTSAGVILLEGAGTGTDLMLEGWTTNDMQKPVFSCAAKVKVSPVEDMYRWLGLREACGQADLASGEIPESGPANRPDAECDGRQFVLVHGFNVNVLEARAMGSEVFKRLWQSGSDSMFTVVNWYGNEDQFTRINGETACINYYANALHAFETAPALVQACNRLPGNKVMLAHSLGNMLVSAAAVDHGLAYDWYFMLNAAVAAEAYNRKDSEPTMVDSRWGEVKDSYRASGWHELFDADDFRSSLSWKGRFAGIRNAINCYSKNEDVVGDTAGASTAIGRSVWIAQEMLKGTWEIAVLGSWPWLDIDSEGGWGVNLSYYSDSAYFKDGKYLPVVNDLPRDKMVKEPLFTSFVTRTEQLHSPERFAPPSDANWLRAKLLCDAIPATSHAAGMKAIGGVKSEDVLQFVNSAMDYPLKINGKPHWRHSDLKNVAYVFNYKLFDYIVNTR